MPALEWQAEPLSGAWSAPVQAGSALRVRLQGVRRRLRLVALGAGSAGAVALFLLTCAFTYAVDRLVVLPFLGRFVALAACAVAGALGLVLGVFRVFLVQPDDEGTALLVERRFGGLRNLLISALQLARWRAGGPERQSAEFSSALIEMVEHEAAAVAADLDFASVVETRGAKRRGAVALAALLLAAVYSALNPAMVTAWAGRILHPFDLHRTYPTRTRLTLLTGNLAVPAGERASVAVAAEGYVPDRGVLLYRQPGTRVGRMECVRDTEPSAQGRRFQVRDLGPIAADTDYAFEVGDAATPWRHIKALPRPQLVDLEVRRRLPDYVRLSDPPPQRLRDIEALVGTEVRLSGQAVVPAPAGGTRFAVQRAAIVLASGAQLPMTVDPAGTIAGGFTVRREDAYRIALAYDYTPPERSGQAPQAAPAVITVTDGQPIWYRVHALPDKPPVITVLEPGPKTDASPIGQVTVRAEVRDDYGVEEAHLWYTVRKPPPPDPSLTRRPPLEDGASAADVDVWTSDSASAAPEPVDRRSFTRVPLVGRFGSRRVTIDHEWLIARTGAQAGDRILYYLSAADGTARPPAGGAAEAGVPGSAADTPQTPGNVTESEMYEIAVVSLEQIERQLREKREAIWAEIRRIYERQSELRREVDDLRTRGGTTRPAPRPQPDE